ncbi:hypothetical protein [Streptomyces sp. NPDC058955]|uniref:hypothetical protein n=1 Tax=unclassified Streptomyces TaxID=2593676 RepID=UPI003664C790
MAHSVFHRELGFVDLSELDLTVPDDSRLWRSLYGRTVKGVLECAECREADPGCPQFMFLRLWKGRPFAVHSSPGRRHATAAERAGLGAALGGELGCTDDPSSPLIERTPWARIDRLPLEAYSGGNALLVRGGVKKLGPARCDAHSPVPCPDRGHGRCTRWHGTWTPALGMRLDRLIGATAAGDYVPLYVPGRRSRAAHMWVSGDDHDRYRDATTDEPAEPAPGHVDDDPAEPERLPSGRSCAHQDRRQGQERHGDAVRDTGALIPAGIALADPRTTPHPQIPPQPGPRDRGGVRQAPVSVGPPDCPTGLVGPCAVCRRPTHRYGLGGSPLCPVCRLDRNTSV